MTEKEDYEEIITNRPNGWILPAAVALSCAAIVAPAIYAHNTYEESLNEQFNTASCETFERPSLTNKTYVVCDDGKARVLSSQPTQFGSSPSSVTFDFADNVQDSFLMETTIDQYYRDDICQAMVDENMGSHRVAKLACGQ